MIKLFFQVAFFELIKNLTDIENLGSNTQHECLWLYFYILCIIVITNDTYEHVFSLYLMSNTVLNKISSLQNLKQNEIKTW